MSNNNGNGDGGTYKYYAYVTHDYGAISVFPFDAASGTVSTSTGAYPVTDSYPFVIIQHPSKSVLYVTCSTIGLKTVRVFSITPTTGSLTEIQNIITLGSDEIEITPDGKYLYTAGSGPITSYKVSEDGKLARVESQSSYPNHIKVAPDGKVLYATYDYFDFDTRLTYLAAYDINPNGTLTMRTKKDFTNKPIYIGVFSQFVYNTTLSGNIYHHNEGASLIEKNYISFADSNTGSLIANRGYLYVVKPSVGQIVGFTINPSTGSLTEFSGTGYPYATGTTFYIRKLSIDPDGKYLYALDEDNKALLGYSIASNGALSQLNWNVTIPDTPRSMTIAKVRQ